MQPLFLRFLREIRRHFWVYLILSVMCVPFIFPFLWMIGSSFKTSIEVFATPPTLMPTTLNWENYARIFEMQPYAQQYWNSTWIAVVVTVGTIVVSSLAGYAFARITFWGSGLLFLLLLSGLMMPEEVTILPRFMLVQSLGLDNTHIPLVIFPIFGSHGVVATFMMRQHFLGMPEELEEAARLDGLGRWGIFWRIAMPIASPVLSAVAIITFLYSWNSFLEPLVFLQDVQLFTLPLALRGFTDEFGFTVWEVQLAATTLSVLPILVFYILAQRLVVESFASSGVKG
ncbi:MAG: carbohydrate ABC transporter permease [Chloroflexaceae bacterium]|nr:carbohydrate ABC transporter permease [Chloroflexaceae bacterium]